MNTKTRGTLFVLLGLAVIAVGLATSQPTAAGPVAQDSGPSTSIPYQGRLTGDDGQPVAAGTLDLIFEIYAAQSDGKPLWTETQTGVQVRDGYFSVLLGGQNPLSVEAARAEHYLAVSVRGPGDADFTALEPRQSLEDFLVRPTQETCGATADHDHWLDTWTGDPPPGFDIPWTGLRVYGSSMDARLVYHFENLATSWDSGVYGESSGSRGTGVRGVGSSYGVHGEGYYGVYGTSSDSGGAGVYATNSSSNTAADLVLGGTSSTDDNGNIYSDPNYTGSDLALYSNDDVNLVLDQDDDETGNFYIYGHSFGGTAILRTTDGYGEAVVATTNNQYSTIYAQNSGSGNGLYAYSNTGTSGYFMNLAGDNIIVAREDFGDGTGNDRFRVTRTGVVRADSSYYSGNGSYLTGYADLAEMLPAANGLKPGDVLVVGSDGRLTLSATPNASNVVGVYSTQPGFVGGFVSQDDGKADLYNPQVTTDGEIASPVAQSDGANAASAREQDEERDEFAAAYADKGQIPLAIAGVVPVKVSAENGPIQPGDLLTTASLPGHAMKASPVDLGGIEIYRPGTIIGKALEALDAGSGVILVLVTLQ